MKYELTREDLLLVDALAQAGLNNPSLRPRYGGQDLEHNAYLGMAAEVAAAHLLDEPLPVPGVIGRYDVGHYQIRARAKRGFDLMIAPEDRKRGHGEDPFILVWPVTWNTYELIGQIIGNDAMVPRYWTGDPMHYLYRKIPHDCWAVPARDLSPIGML